MKVVIVVLMVLLSGCFNQLSRMSSNMAKIEVGMTESAVISAIGNPTAVSAKDGLKIYNYKLYTTTSAAVMDASPSDYYVIFQGGVVVVYGGVHELKALSK